MDKYRNEYSEVICCNIPETTRIPSVASPHRLTLFGYLQTWGTPNLSGVSESLGLAQRVTIVQLGMETTTGWQFHSSQTVADARVKGVSDREFQSVELS